MAGAVTSGLLASESTDAGVIVTVTIGSGVSVGCDVIVACGTVGTTFVGVDAPSACRVGSETRVLLSVAVDGATSQEISVPTSASNTASPTYTSVPFLNPFILPFNLTECGIYSGFSGEEFPLVVKHDKTKTAFAHDCWSTLSKWQTYAWVPLCRRESSQAFDAPCRWKGLADKLFSDNCYRANLWFSPPACL
jgi:hypothetical protein